MKRQQKSVWSNIVFLIVISILLGSGKFVFGQVLPRIDGFYVDPKATAEVNRAIFIRPDTFGESALIVGTNKGNAMFAKMNTDESLFKQPVFKPFAFQPLGSLVRDINFVSYNNGYLLKSDGIYSSDGKSNTWKQIVSINDLPKESGSTAELWSIGFIDNLRACIVGVYLKNTSDRSIDKELLLCTNNIADKNQWKEPRKPRDMKTQLLQLTNIYFDRNQHGWAVGTDGEEGFIWYSDDGGNTWEEQNTKIPSPLLGVYAIEKKAIVIGFNGLVLGKGFTKNNSVTNIIPTLRVGDKVEVQNRIISKIPGIGTITGTFINIIGEVKEIKDNKMLRIKVSKVSPDALKDRAKSYFDKNDVSPMDVKKVEEEDSDEDVSTEWGKFEGSSLPKNLTATLRSIKFAENSLDGFIVGDKGTILYTLDGGKTWKSLVNAQLAAIDFYSIFVDEKYCWIAGSKGAVVRVKYR